MSRPALMNDEELYEFLMGERRFAAVASIRKDGSPWAVPLGYWFDGHYVYLTMNPSNSGTRRLRRDPRVALTVFNTTFPPKAVTIAGVAEEIPDPDWEISRRIHRRYPKGHVVDEEEYERQWLSEGKVVFRVPAHDRASLDVGKVIGRSETAWGQP